MKFLFTYNWATQREPTAVIPKLQDIPACVSFFLLSWYLFCSLLVSGIVIQYKIHPARVFFLKFVNSTNLLVRNLYIAKHTVSLLWKLPIKHNHTHAAIILFPLQEEPMLQIFVWFFLELFHDTGNILFSLFHKWFLYLIFLSSSFRSIFLYFVCDYILLSVIVVVVKHAYILKKPIYNVWIISTHVKYTVSKCPTFSEENGLIQHVSHCKGIKTEP